MRINLRGSQCGTGTRWASSCYRQSHHVRHARRPRKVLFLLPFTSKHYKHDNGNHILTIRGREAKMFSGTSGHFRQLLLLIMHPVLLFVFVSLSCTNLWAAPGWGPVCSSLLSLHGGQNSVHSRGSKMLAESLSYHACWTGLIAEQEEKPSELGIQCEMELLWNCLLPGKTSSIFFPLSLLTLRLPRKRSVTLFCYVFLS